VAFTIPNKSVNPIVMSLTVKPASIPLILPKVNALARSTKESSFRAVTKDEEISICQIIEKINDRLFDEYRSELLTYRQEIGAFRRNT